MSLMGYVYAKLLSRVQLYATPWTVAFQAPLSMGLSRQEYWSGLPCPPPGDLPNPGIERVSLISPALTGGLYETLRKPTFSTVCVWLSHSVSFLSCWTDSEVGTEREGDGYWPFPSTQSHRLFSPGAWDPREPLRRRPCPQALQAEE